jgi:hypothetical protein
MATNDNEPSFVNGARQLATQARSALRDKTIWLPGVPRLQLLFKAALVRQVESLEAAVVLADADRGHSALPFVRPACEEYLWLKYLLHLEQSDAEQLVDHLGREQVLDVLRAQEHFAGEEATAGLGLGGVRARYEDAVKVRSSSRQQLGERLHWERETIKHARLPKTRYIAKQVDELSMYDFIYGASSRHVHFNVAELLRRVWGDGVVYDIGSRSFSKYFTAFALSWTSRLLAKTIVLAEPLLPGMVSRFRTDDAWIDLLPTGLMPIVTAEELSALSNAPIGAG